MKKNRLFIIVGLLLLFAGLVLFISNKHNSSDIIYIGEDELTTSDAEVIIKEKVNKLIKLYEVPNEAFKIEEKEDSDYYNVLNYDEIVKLLFSENGIKEFENTKFGDKQLVVKDENSVSILKNIPDNNKFLNSDIFVDNIKIQDDIINANVTFSFHGLRDDILSYYLYVKDMKLVKSDNDWLIESFIYSN